VPCPGLTHLGRGAIENALRATTRSRRSIRRSPAVTPCVTLALFQPLKSRLSDWYRFEIRTNDVLIAYYVVTEDRCFTIIIGDEPIALEAGEVIVYTKGDAHALSSSPGMRADPLPPGALDAVAGSQLPFVITYGSDGPTTAKFVCATSPAMPNRSIRCSTICRRSSKPETSRAAMRAAWPVLPCGDNRIGKQARRRRKHPR
jgi:hypothetical protein